MQGLGRVVHELLRSGAVELLEQRHRMVEVVGADLDQLLARTLLEPAGEARMVAGAGGLRQPCVGHLADQHVLEAEGDLAADRRARLGQQEVAQEQVVEGVADILDVR